MYDAKNHVYLISKFFASHIQMSDSLTLMLGIVPLIFGLLSLISGSVKGHFEKNLIYVCSNQNQIFFLQTYKKNYFFNSYSYLFIIHMEKIFTQNVQYLTLPAIPSHPIRGRFVPPFQMKKISLKIQIFLKLLKLCYELGIVKFFSSVSLD